MKVFIACLYINIEDNTWKRQIDKSSISVKLGETILL